VRNYNIRARFEFKLEDFWFGVFWKRNGYNPTIDIWVCLLPCLPLHITLSKEQCPSCGAWVKKLGTASDGSKFCCVHCCFNPLGCRCRFGHIGVAETDIHWSFDEDSSF